MALTDEALVTHLQCEDTNDRLVVADAVLHVAGVQVLPDLQRVFLVLFRLVELPLIWSEVVFILLVRWSFGSEPPQNPVCPGRFAFLTAGQVVINDVRTESREQGGFD